MRNDDVHVMLSSFVSLDDFRLRSTVPPRSRRSSTYRFLRNTPTSTHLAFFVVHQDHSATAAAWLLLRVSIVFAEPEQGARRMVCGIGIVDSFSDAVDSRRRLILNLIHCSPR